MIMWDGNRANCILLLVTRCLIYLLRGRGDGEHFIFLINTQKYNARLAEPQKRRRRILLLPHRLFFFFLLLLQTHNFSFSKYILLLLFMMMILFIGRSIYFEIWSNFSPPYFTDLSSSLVIFLLFFFCIVFFFAVCYVDVDIEIFCC